MTQRLFKLKGVLTTDSAAGIVTIDGIKVFDGAFTIGSNSEPDGYLCEFTHPVEDQYGWELEPLDVNLPVTVTVTTGTAEVGMFKYNYICRSNPLLTLDEMSYLTNGTAAVAPIAIKADVAAKGGWQVACVTEFDYGTSFNTTYCNRFDISVDRVVMPPESGHSYITVNAGETLSFTTVIFSVPYQ